MTIAQRESVLHTGELLLDEARKFGVCVWLGEKTGNVLWVPKRSRYFNEQLQKHTNEVKIALENECTMTTTEI